MFLSLQEDSQFPREAIIGTAAEKDAIRERNKLVERRERKWIDEHTKVYYELKQVTPPYRQSKLRAYHMELDAIYQKPQVVAELQLKLNRLKTYFSLKNS